MSAATKELLQFLSEEAPSLPIRVSASEYLLGLTGGDDGRKFIATIGSDLTNVLVNLLSSQSHPLNLNAIKSIVNLASDESSLDYLREGSLLRKLFDLITEHDCQNEHSVNVSENSVLALSNMAHWQTGAQAIVKFFQKSGNEMILYKVIERFFKDTDHLHHFASFLSNLSQVKEARLFILDKDKLVFQRITSFISFTKSKVRQKGVVATIKNCCFEEGMNSYIYKVFKVLKDLNHNKIFVKKTYQGDHKWLLSDEVDILPRLLLPLAGNEEFDEEDNNKLPLDLQYLGDDKERECDPGIRKMLIEAVFQVIYLIN